MGGDPLRRLGWILFWAGVVWLGAVDPAQALFCPKGTVSEGDRKVEVLARCGEPTWREERLEEVAEKVFPDGGRHGVLDEHRVTSTVEEWVYNFGPNRLLHFLTFRNGKLVDIRTGGYGYVVQGPAEARVQCWSESMARGRRKVEVLHYCGEPTSVDVRYVERARRYRDRQRRRVLEKRVTVTVEEWTYNFGPHRLLYVFVFENGTVVDVETEGYGY